MKLPKETLAGARMITAHWDRALCDVRGSCGHDHTPPPGGFERRDLFADLKLIDDLRRFERDDFAPEVTSAPPQSSGGARQEDDSTDDERGRKLTWLLRLRWQSHASWLGLDRSASGGYRGEESAASLDDASR